MCIMSVISLVLSCSYPMQWGRVTIVEAGTEEHLYLADEISPITVVV